MRTKSGIDTRLGQSAVTIGTHGSQVSAPSLTSVLRKRTYKKLTKILKFYIFGSAYEAYRKPYISIKDYIIMVMNLQLGLRFVCNYIDLTLTWGGAFVFVVFSVVNILMGSTLAGLYSFLGLAGNRTFLNFWDMMPFFQGIAYSMILIQILVIAEDTLIATHPAEELFSNFKRQRAFQNQNAVMCNVSKYQFIPGTGMQLFTYEKIDISIFTNYVIDTYRIWLILAVLFIVLGFRIVQFKIYRIFLTLFTCSFYGIIVITTFISTFIRHQYATILIFPEFTNQAHFIEALLQISIFAIGDYLPGHFITLGFIMEDNQTIMTKIWSIIIIKCSISFCLLYLIPTIPADFRDLIGLDRDHCLQFSGVYFIFAIFPYVVSKYVLLKLSFRIIYFTSVLFFGIGNALMQMDLLNFAVANQKMIYYRYRNLIFLLIWIICGTFTIFLGLNGFPYFFYFINFTCHYTITLCVMATTTLGIAIYNLERINGDYRFLYSSAFMLQNSTKIYFLFYFIISVTAIVDISIGENSHEKHYHVSYTIITTLCLVPLSYGIFTLSRIKAKYHGLCQPSPNWGSVHQAVRNHRRSKANRTMYTYRMKGQCDHNCLIGHPALKRKIERDKELQDIIQGWCLSAQSFSSDTPLAPHVDSSSSVQMQ